MVEDFIQVPPSVAWWDFPIPSDVTSEIGNRMFECVLFQIMVPFPLNVFFVDKFSHF